VVVVKLNFGFWGLMTRWVDSCMLKNVSKMIDAIETTITVIYTVHSVVASGQYVNAADTKRGGKFW